ncbi:MAG: hypothetical protein LIP28_06875 [Deltaproteobacteria bacterium]|nr:hypothetical protein [Deltaproteobacteria bacterium]
MRRFPSDDPADIGSELDYLIRTSEALASFTMVDPAEEAVRKECLAHVRESLRIMRQENPDRLPSQAWPVKE